MSKINEVNAKKREILNKIRPTKPFGEAAGHTVYCRYRNSAKKRGLDFGITEVEFNILTKQNCFYCGNQPSQISNPRKANGYFIFNGIDRLDNSKGYSMFNAVTCCKWCNRAKDVMGRDEFLGWVNRVKSHSEKTKVYVGATMDMFHSGHINLLRKARDLGDIVIVVLNKDEFVEKYKRKPAIPLESRIAILSECRLVDIVDVNEYGEDSKPMLLKYKPHIVLHGDDYTPERYLKQMSLTPEFVAENGFKIVSVPYTKGISTTELLNNFLNHK